MRQLDGRLIGIDQGRELLFSDFEDGGEMWTGQGPRSKRIAVRFSEPFQAPPVVHVSMNMLDLDSETNPRADLSAEEITEQGFTLVFQTWADTRVARVRADWLAIGPLRDDSLWEVD